MSNIKDTSKTFKVLVYDVDKAYNGHAYPYVEVGFTKGNTPRGIVERLRDHPACDAMIRKALKFQPSMQLLDDGSCHGAIRLLEMKELFE